MDTAPAPSLAADLLVVRSCSSEDLPFAAALHAQALPHGFFTRLGERFLTAYYESFLASPHALAFVAATTARPVGVLVGTVRGRTHLRWVLRHRGWRLGWLGALALLTRPRQLAFFVRTRLLRYARGVLRNRRRRVGHAAEPPARHTATLSHVAVAHEARGAGAGAALVAAFASAARRAGCDEAALVTLADGRGAGPFYERLGWTRRRDLVDRDGRPISFYTRRL